jgi:hypothetical protein
MPKDSILRMIWDGLEGQPIEASTSLPDCDLLRHMTREAFTKRYVEPMVAVIHNRICDEGLAGTVAHEYDDRFAQTGGKIGDTYNLRVPVKFKDLSLADDWEPSDPD